jgi:hypothetical protein
MKNINLIIIPLVIMFLLALTINSVIFNEDIGATFNTTRTVSQTTLENITVNSEYIWDNTTYWLSWVHKAQFNLVMTSLLNTKFGVSQGHEAQSNNLFDARDTKGSNLSQSEVYEIIKYNPNLVSELEPISGFGISLGSSTYLFIGLFLGAITLVAILGIRIFGSGISETSIGVIFTLVILTLLWGILSALTYNLFEEVPLGLGLIIYTIMTFMYAIGGFILVFNSGE